MPHPRLFLRCCLQFLLHRLRDELAQRDTSFRQPTLPGGTKNQEFRGSFSRSHITIFMGMRAAASYSGCLVVMKIKQVPVQILHSELPQSPGFSFQRFHDVRT